MSDKEIAKSLNELDVSIPLVGRLEEKRKKPINSKIQEELSVNRIRSLYTNGLTVFEIHTETGLDLSYCRRIVKRIKQDIEEYTRQAFFKQLKSKVIQILDNHTSIQAQLVKAFWSAVTEKDLEKQVALAREISRYDKELSQTLSGMGVSKSSESVETLPPDEGPIKNKIHEIEFEEIKATDEAGIREEVKKSMARLNEHIKSIEEVDKEK